MLKRREVSKSARITAGDPRSNLPTHAETAPGPLPPKAELTFLVDPAALRAFGAHPLLGGPAKLSWGAQHGVGYDTQAGALHRCGIALQVRRSRARNVLSLATDAGPVEVTTPGEAPQIELLPPDARGLIARATDNRSLKPWFSWRMRRATRMVSYAGARIEVAFEEGEIAADSRRTPIREIGLRLKSGEEAGLYRLGLALAQIGPLRLGVVDKFERGRALVLDRAFRSVKSEPPLIGADVTLDAAIGVLLRQNLSHFLMNWPALDFSDADEGVHQIRVALRRLRSLLAVLRRTFPAGEIDLLRAEAKHIADAFGEARDWRAFSDLVADGPGRRLPAARGFAALLALADARSGAGRDAGENALAGRATTQFVLSLQIYICMHGWRNAALEVELRALGEPAIGFAAEALERSFRRLKNRARGFAALPPETRHQVRIALKQVRYAVDFFGPLFEPADDVGAFAERASVLQDLLGAANDAAVAGRLVESVDAADDPALAYAAGAVAGWCERGGALDEKTLLRSWKALRKARRFWRDHLRQASSARSRAAKPPRIGGA